jgi:tryptophan synthase alpha chain
MNRIDSIFADHRRKAEKAILPFLTAGDPDLATTGRLLEAVQDAGASICELGFAFSDPVADGPVIEASMARVLNQGVRLEQVFELVARCRAKLHMGLVAMVSYSIVYRVGVKAFLRDAKQAGIDGLILPDLPLAASTAVRDTAGQLGLTCSFMIAPTTPIERARQIAKASSGFVYLLSRSGLTGESSVLPLDLPERVAALRSVTDLPIAVGFGIANPTQVKDVLAVADAAVVGSAIMRRVAEHHHQGSDTIVEQVDRFVRRLAQGLVQGATP